MKPPKDMTAIIDRKRYSTTTATLLAGDDYWDGRNYERSGRNTFLYRTPRGNYFAVYLSRWQGEADSIEPLSQDEAISLFEGMREQRVAFEEAFPDVKVEEA
jgi:hypothetical protein